MLVQQLFTAEFTFFPSVPLINDRSFLKSRVKIQNVLYCTIKTLVVIKINSYVFISLVLNSINLFHTFLGDSQNYQPRGAVHLMNYRPRPKAIVH